MRGGKIIEEAKSRPNNNFSIVGSQNKTKERLSKLERSPDDIW